MNGLSLTHFALEGSSPLPHYGRGCPCGPERFSQQLWSNASLKSSAPRQLQTSNRDVLEPPPNILTPKIPPCRCQRHQRQSTPANLIPDERFAVSLFVLEEDFRLRKDIYLTFPLEVNNSITKEVIERFRVNIENIIKHMDHVYYCCSQFVHLLELESIPDNNAVLMATFETHIFHCYDLDICGCCSGSFNFCHDCWTYISKSREPKFSISNKISQLCCQYYPVLLEDLTSAEEAVIARAYLVITILKLRPNNSFNPRTYKGVCGHSVLLPQNLGSLLTLLPSKTTSVDDVVRVVWAGKTSP